MKTHVLLRLQFVSIKVLCPISWFILKQLVNLLFLSMSDSELGCALLTTAHRQVGLVDELLIIFQYDFYKTSTAHLLSGCENGGGLCQMV